MDLYATAEQIPSMGGSKIGSLLREATRKAFCNRPSWKSVAGPGLETAQLALGIREREHEGDVRLHCYDRWPANKPEVEKAAKRGWHLGVGEEPCAEFNVPVRLP